MMPNRWKTLAFGLGISVAGLATCADQPNGQLHKAKKADEPAEIAAARWEDPQPVPLPSPPKSEPTVRVREFLMDVPDVNPAPAKPAPAPVAVPAFRFELPDPTPAIVPVRATIPVSPAPAVLEPSLIRLDPPVPDLPKPAEMKVAVPEIKSAPPAEFPPAIAPLKPNFARDEFPAPPAPKREAVPFYPVPSAALPAEIVPVEAKSVPKPEERPTPPPAPRRAGNPNQMKLIITLGDGNPRFEVKHIATNKTLLKAEAAGIDISRFAEPNSQDSTLLQKLLASGPIRFSGPDIQGTCDELSILAGTGEVLLKGNVQMKTLTSKSWTTLQSDKVVYQIGNMPAERTATTAR